MGNNKLLPCERLPRQGEAELQFTSNCRAIKHSSGDPTAVPLEKNIFSSGDPEPARPELLTGERLVTPLLISAGVGELSVPLEGGDILRTAATFGPAGNHLGSVTP